MEEITASIFLITSTLVTFSDVYIREKFFCSLELKAGRSFVTNGPALFVRVDGCRPGDVVRVASGHELEVEVAWESYHAVERIELVLNGEVLSVCEVSPGERHGLWRFSWRPQEDGWLAARLVSRVRDSYYQPVFAHTSPIWLQAGKPPAAREASAAFFIKSLDEALQWVQGCARFADEEQRAEVTDLLRSGQDEFRRLL